MAGEVNEARTGQHGERERMSFQFTHEEEAPHFYANNTQVTISPFDVRLSFGEIVKVDLETAKLIVRLKASIAMSPQHAKAMMLLLKRQLDLYESKFGAIPVLDSGDVGEKTTAKTVPTEP